MTAIGIDLGTTNSCVGVWQNGKVEILQNDQGNRLTPSVVAFTETERLIGDAAKYQAAFNPENTIYNVKRLIGRKFHDEETQKDIKLLPFKVINDSDTPKIEVEYLEEKKVFALEEISSMILAKLKDTAESYLGTPVRDAVITVPAYFNDSQKQATIDAGKIAGLNVLRIISEPTAAALAYGIEKNIDSERNVLIYDLGGGTFDVSILSVKKSSYFKVLSTSGDTHLGGEDIDNLLVDYFAKEFKEQKDVDISDNTKVLARLRKESEQAKINLSSSLEAKIEIESLHEGIPFQTKISRARFDEICLKLFTRTLIPVEIALKDAKLERSDIDDIVLVGGSSRIPKIQSLLKDFFNGKTLTKNINADEVVAHGAAIQAANLSEAKNSSLPKLFVIDVAPLSLGIETKGGIMTKIINRNTSIPCKESKTFSTTVDNAEAITFSIFEGERLLAIDNNLLGKFELTNIPLAPMGVPEILCTFEINEDGILNVTAKEGSSGISKNIVIHNDRGRLSKREIDRMIADAEGNKINDEKEKNRIDVRNRLEYFAIKTKQNAEKSDWEEPMKADIINKCYEAIKWLDSNFLASEEEHLRQLHELQKHCEALLGKNI